MGLITSLNLSNFSFHSLELAATLPARLQRRFSVRCLERFPLGLVVAVTDAERRWVSKEVSAAGLRDAGCCGMQN